MVNNSRLRLACSISIKVIPGVRFESFEKLSEGWVIRIREKAIDGKANEAVCKQVSEFLKLPQSLVTVIKGAKSRQKLLRIESVNEVYVENCFTLVVEGKDNHENGNL